MGGHVLEVYSICVQMSLGGYASFRRRTTCGDVHYMCMLTWNIGGNVTEVYIYESRREYWGTCVPEVYTTCVFMNIGGYASPRWKAGCGEVHHTDVSTCILGDICPGGVHYMCLDEYRGVCVPQMRGGVWRGALYRCVYMNVVGHVSVHSCRHICRMYLSRCPSPHPAAHQPCYIHVDTYAECPLIFM